MKKSKKTQNENYNINLPAVVSMETLSYATDDDLERHLSYLHSEKERAYRGEYDLRPWEVEICYVERELQIRHDRRNAHERYLRSAPEAGFYSESSSVGR